MNHSVWLMVRYQTRVDTLTTGCINFTLEKERYTPYTQLSGQWYMPQDAPFSEVVAIILYIDGAIKHYGYPTDIETVQKDGRTVLKFKSVGYTAALVTNQCPDGLITQMNLQSLASKMDPFPVVVYQQDTPTVNYVNYYNGTSAWEAIVCYSIRAVQAYPYIYGFNTVRIEPPPTLGYLAVTSDRLISQSYKTDYTKMISKITEKDIDGTEGAFVGQNGIASQRTIMRAKEIPFDHEWIMSPKEGLAFKLDYSMRAMNCDCFSFFGYYADFDLLDQFAVTDQYLLGEADRIRITATPERGFVTTVWCYHDAFCY